jgi:catechol-2,3-dioxygenase
VPDKAKSVIESIGMINGHYECRALKDTVPVLSHVLALEVVNEKNGEVTMKHPNSGWLLVVHEGGPAAPDKPFRNHYGVRVTNNQEVDAAYEYLTSKQEELGLKKIVRRKDRSGAYSIYLVEPGGNYWEIESYENRANMGLPREVAYPWKRALTPADFPGKGYIPQAFTHGTIECDSLQASVKFYKECLGLDVVSHVPGVEPHDAKHPSNPWYVVSLEVPSKSRNYLTPLQRFTLAVESASALDEARRRLQECREEFGVSELHEISGHSFLLSDLNRNWWEVTCVN